jgi:hypothetical protein
MNLSRNEIGDNGARQLTEALQNNKVKGLSSDIRPVIFNCFADVAYIRPFVQFNQQTKSMSIEKRRF